MNDALDRAYFEWLYGQVASLKAKSPSRTHWALLRQLFKTEFVWFVPNDDNRAEDGKALRHEFLNEQRINRVGAEWLSVGCSMLEMLVALSRWIAFEAGGDSRDWFWHMLSNIEIDQYNDRVYNREAEERIQKALNTVIWRIYNRNGTGGGLFPLKKAVRDQRDVELWYQLNTYLIENL